MKEKKNSKWFWTVTILCLMALFASPILLYTLENKFPGAITFGGAIILWLIMIIIHEYSKG